MEAVRKWTLTLSLAVAAVALLVIAARGGVPDVQAQDAVATSAECTELLGPGSVADEDGRAVASADLATAINHHRANGRTNGLEVTMVMNRLVLVCAW